MSWALWTVLTELACLRAWLMSSLICEMFFFRLSWSSWMGFSFSSNLSASFSRSFTLAPAAWTTDTHAEERPSQTLIHENVTEQDKYGIRNMLDSTAMSKGEWKALKQEHKRPWKNSDTKEKMGDGGKRVTLYISHLQHRKRKTWSCYFKREDESKKRQSFHL